MSTVAGVETRRLLGEGKESERANGPAGDQQDRNPVGRMVRGPIHLQCCEVIQECKHWAECSHLLKIILQHIQMAILFLVSVNNVKKFN